MTFTLLLHLALVFAAPYPVRVVGWAHPRMSPADVDRVYFGCAVGPPPGEPNYIKFLMERNR